MRRGLYSPGMHLPIVMEDELVEQPDVYYVLAWNFRKEILANNRALLEQGVEFYFPVDAGGRLTMEILITGATGFLGTALSAHLESLGHRVVRLGSRNCDLTRPDSLESFDDRRYDQIYHLAAWTQAGDFCLRHPGEQWFINQQINTNVLAWWQARQPQAKLIAMGTSCAYPPDRELVEENYLEGQPIESLFTYAMTKRMLYVGPAGAGQQFGLRYLCLVPSTLYGPGYHTDGRQMHFIFDLIRKILRARNAAADRRFSGATAISAGNWSTSMISCGRRFSWRRHVEDESDQYRRRRGVLDPRVRADHLRADRL